MVDGTSATEPRRVAREPLSFGVITVVGGGCYGSYYVRQLARAYAAGAIAWEQLVVVDRRAECQVASLPTDERPPGLELHVAEWAPYFDAYLSAASNAPDVHERDAIVPSPLMPHLMAHWIVDRARRRWP